jgi:hypothetical protein
MTQDQEHEAAATPRHPSYCPTCGCSDPARFPKMVTSTVVGCHDCKSVWDREKFMQLTVTTNPAVNPLTTR